MGSVNNLKMLYLLTFADVKAVGPEVWNPWKASLLGELYVKTLNLLEEVEKGEFQRQDVRAALRRIQTRVRRELVKSHAEEKVESFLEAMPERYFLSTPESDIPGHFELMERFRGKKPEVAVRAFSRTGLHVSRGVLAGPARAFCLDHRRFDRRFNFDILNARIFTASDGRILDVFQDFPSWTLRTGHGRAKMDQVSCHAGGRFGRKNRCRTVWWKRPKSSLVLAKARAQSRAPRSISTTRPRTISPSSRYLPRIASAFFLRSRTVSSSGTLDSRREDFHQCGSGSGCFLRHRPSR